MAQNNEDDHYNLFGRADYLYGEVSGQPDVDTEATEPVGDPIEEVGREPPGPPMPCRLMTPLLLIACACEQLTTITIIRSSLHVADAASSTALGSRTGASVHDTEHRVEQAASKVNNAEI